MGGSAPVADVRLHGAFLLHKDRLVLPPQADVSLTGAVRVCQLCLAFLSLGKINAGVRGAERGEAAAPGGIRVRLVGAGLELLRPNRLTSRGQPSYCRKEAAGCELSRAVQRLPRTARDQDGPPDSRLRRPQRHPVADGVDT